MNDKKDFAVGDKVVCSTGVSGTIIKIYNPTASEKQVMVVTKEGRKYHAPERMWRGQR